MIGVDRRKLINATGLRNGADYDPIMLAERISHELGLQRLEVLRAIERAPCIVWVPRPGKHPRTKWRVRVSSVDKLLADVIDLLQIEDATARLSKGDK